MALAVGLKFHPDEFARFFQPADFDLAEKDFCVALDERTGQERIGYVDCVEGRAPCQFEHLKPIVRLATEDEIVRWHALLRRQRDSLSLARTKVVEHGLSMKLISVQFDDAQNIVHFNFTADHRIDFRDLVRDLAGQFKARIELWQIGARKGGAEKDGFGVCGQRMCCTCWMKDYPPVSVRHARNQDISLTPPKLAGQCGRLRCCLRYEYDGYCEMRREAPPVDGRVRDAAGREGVVVDRNLLTRKAQVMFEGARLEWQTFGELTILARPAKERLPKPPPVPEDEDEAIPEDGD